MRLLTIFITLLALATACTVEVEPLAPATDIEKPLAIPGDATEGEIIIKFSPEMEDILEATMTRSGGSATRS